jgi:hypothetical protein
METTSIPKQYGGELDWQWGEMPNLDDEARKLVGGLETPPAEGETKSSFIKGPILFKGDRVEILGKVNGESRKSSIPVPTTSTLEPSKANISPAAEVNEKVALENGSSEKATNGDVAG